MNSKFVRQNIFPVLAAFIWGTAFVAQSVAADLVQPFTFNASRAFVGFGFLLVLCIVLRIKDKPIRQAVLHRPYHRRHLLRHRPDPGDQSPAEGP